MGAVTKDSIKITVRYPPLETVRYVTENTTEPVTENTIKIVWKELEAGSEAYLWKNGPVLQLKAADDWVSTGKLSGLWPSRLYQCE